jgi:SagB-type dehydrogenase family enzyme
VGNWEDPGAALRYHEATKHSFVSVRTSGHRLDWENRPHPFKEYLELEPGPLPPELDRLLRVGAGVVRTRTLAGGDPYHFRAYASAGALYPVEIYPVTPDGVFHFHPRELVLRRLREGDFRAMLGEPDAAAVLVFTGILWRTAWKYGERGYRHLFWDAGTMLANLLALAGDDELRLVTGFVDDDVNRLVGADGRHEAVLALLALGRAPAASGSPEPEALRLDVMPLSRSEPRFPLAEAMHAATALANADEVARYRGAGAPPEDGVPTDLTAGEPLERVIRRRGSARDFLLEPVPSRELAAILDAAGAPIPADVGPVTATYLFANAVGGLEPGAYRFQPPGRFELRRQGAFRGWAGYLALEQEHAARAAATHFLLADLPRVVEERGNRGYRWAQLEAGIRAGRMYLGAYARRLGATGLTFYDDDVARFLTGDTAEQPMLCVALGPAARASRRR